jgi:O-antigen/teichoic acid export membrane protein
MSLYGAGFSASWPVLVVTLVTGAVLAVQFPVNQLLNASGKLWVVFFLNLWWAVLFVGFNTLMIDKGALGLVTARLIAYLLQGLVVVMLIRSLPVVREQQHDA